MKRILIAIAVLSLIAVASTAQKHDKPWQEWSKKDAEKILNDSPWGQTQTETDVSEMFYTPTTQGGRGSSSSRQTQGALISRLMSISASDFSPLSRFAKPSPGL